MKPLMITAPPKTGSFRVLKLEMVKHLFRTEFSRIPSPLHPKYLPITLKIPSITPWINIYPFIRSIQDMYAVRAIPELIDNTNPNPVHRRLLGCLFQFHDVCVARPEIDLPFPESVFPLPPSIHQPLIQRRRYIQKDSISAFLVLFVMFRDFRIP